MSGGASSSSNTGGTRPSADCSLSDLETKRIHGDHSTPGVVMLMNDSDFDQSVSQCWRVGRQRGVFLVDVNDWDSASRDHLRALGSDGTLVTCTSYGATKELMSNESRELDLLAAARDRDGRQGRRTVATAKSSTQSLFIVPRWKRRIRGQDESLRHWLPDPMLQRKGVEFFAQCGLWRTRVQIASLSFVQGGLHSFAAGEETGTSTSQNRLTVVKAVTAQCSPAGWSRDAVVALFGVRKEGHFR